MTTRIERWLEGLAALQARRPGFFLLAGTLLLAGALPLVTNLGLNSSFTALLPEDKPSVRDLERTKDRVGGLATLTLAIQSEDTEALTRFARDLVPRLEALDEAGIYSVEWNVAEYEDFVREHAHLYADRQKLEEIRDALEERLDYERAKANPFYVDLSDEAPPDPEQIVREAFEEDEEAAEKRAKYPGGFFLHPDGDLLAMFVRTDISGGDAAATDRLTNAIDEVVADLGPEAYAGDLRVEYAGDIMHAREEHEAIKNELTMAVSLTLVLVFVAIFIFFRRLRSIPLLGASLMVPVVVTFAFAELAVDYLNTSTAFLGSIVIGNGINPNIIWLARYFEERRDGRDSTESLRRTHLGVWSATLTASLAAAIAYGSLVVTDFRGFRDFGIIGGIGMVLCWLGAFLLLPALTAFFERMKPLRPRKGERGIYGVLFFRLASGFPKTVVGVSAVLGVAGLVLVVLAVLADPLEYDFRRLKSVREESSRVTELNARINEFLSKSATGNAIAILVDDRSQVAPLVERLKTRREAEDAPAYGRIRTVDDLLPKEVDEKRPVLSDIRETLLELRRFADDEQREAIDEHMPPESLEPVRAEDLPEAVARPFTERDGTRGRILFVEQNPDFSTWDGRYLVDWSNALREVRLEDGKRPPLAGRAPVFADMIEVIWVDGPIAIGVSFTATLVLLLFAFRSRLHRLATIAALLLGIVWMAGTMAAIGMKLNFLNFVAFPITFGNGADYGVNVMRRFREEEHAGVFTAIKRAVEESGGAVILCSLTTIIGYGSLYVSANRALNSFGLAMGISEVTCLAAAVLTVPAYLLWRHRRRQGE